MPPSQRLETSGARRAALRQSRWDEILGAAGTLFFERGFEGATMQDIAERVGLLAGSLYYYIDTKEDLLYELALRVARESLKYIDEDSRMNGESAPTRLAAFIERWMHHVREAEPRAAYAAVERHRASLSPDRRAEVDGERRKVRVYLAGILAQGVTEGSLDPLSVSVAINNILWVLWSTATWFDPHGERTFDEITEWYKTFLLRGLGVPDDHLAGILETASQFTAVS